MSALGWLRRSATASAIRLARAVLRSPRLKSLARAILARFPAMQGRLRALMLRSALAPHAKWSVRPQSDGDLSPRTQRMLDELRRARQRPNL